MCNGLMRNWKTDVLSILCLIFLCSSFALGANDGIEEVTERLPADTIFLGYTPNVRDLISRAEATSLGRALLESPNAQLLDTGLDCFANLGEASPIHQALQKTRMVDVIASILDGPCHVAVIPVNGKVEWLVFLSLDQSIDLTSGLDEGKRKIRFGLVDFDQNEEADSGSDFLNQWIQGEVSFGELESDTYVESVQKSSITVAFDQSSIILASSSAAMRSLKRHSRSLANSRRYREIKNLCQFGTSDNELQCYFNLSSYMDSVFETKTDFQKSGALDFLTIGARIHFEKDTEFGIDGFISHALPRDGISSAIRLDPLKSPVEFDVPENIGFYLQANLDLKELRKNLIAFDKEIRVRTKIPQYLSRRIGIVAPLAVMLCSNPESELSLDCFSGQVESFGHILESQGALSIAMDNCMGLAQQDSELLARIQDQVSGFDQLKLVSNGKLKYLTWSDELFNQVKSTMDRSGDSPKSPIKRQAWGVGCQRLIYSNDVERMIPLLQNELPDELLADSEAVKFLWEESSEKDSPGLFLYVKGAELYLPLYIFLRNRILAESDWAQHRSDYLVRNKETDSPEYRYRQKSLKIADGWDFQKFSNSFGPSSLAIYQKDRGFQFRFIQTNPDIDSDE